MAKKYKVQQWFDTDLDGEWLFDTADEAIAFYEKKQRALRGAFLADVDYLGQVEVEEN